MSIRAHTDFSNVVRVPRFHQAPQRLQSINMGIVDPDKVIILPVIRIERMPDVSPVYDPRVPANKEGV